MAEDNENNEEFLRMFREFLEGSGSFDMSELAGAAGLPQDPALIAQMMSQFQSALNSTETTADESAAQRATQVASGRQIPITDEERAAASQAFHIAGLWLSEQTALAPSTETGTVMNRVEWVNGSLPAWRELSDPISDSIGDTLVTALQSQAPEEMVGAISGASKMLRGLGKTLFSMQLGQVVGQLSQEVVSATEIGVPLFADHKAALVPQNVTEFARDLGVPTDQVDIFLATRELAHAGLFRDARWLSLHLTTAIRDYASGLSIDIERMQETIQSIDISDTTELRAAINSGALLAPRTEAQLAALGRIETLFALIEGWVDVVTADATTRLPKADALRETMNRRRASGGPAEQAFGALIGVEFRPRKLREAAAMWRAIGEKLGSEARDALWSHPDVLPTADDISAPDALIARLTNPSAPDEMDLDLERLLAGDFEGVGDGGAGAGPETDAAAELSDGGAGNSDESGRPSGSAPEPGEPDEPAAPGTIDPPTR